MAAINTHATLISPIKTRSQISLAASNSLTSLSTSSHQSPRLSTCGSSMTAALSDDDDESASEMSVSSNEEDDDDMAGVFFGPRNPVEVELIAKLSQTIDPIEATFSPETHSSRRQSSRRSTGIVRLRKRDSRDFIRRKTLLLPGVDNSPEKVEGIAVDSGKGKTREVIRERLDVSQIREKNDQESSDSSSSSPVQARFDIPTSPTPVTSTLEDTSDLTLHLASFHLTQPLLEGSDTKEGEGEPAEEEPASDGEDDEDDGGVENDFSSEESGEESDKENTLIPNTMSASSSEDNLRDVGQEDGAVVMGLGVYPNDGVIYTGEVDNQLAELDMGGLKLSDFADPTYPENGLNGELSEEFGENSLDFDDISGVEDGLEDKDPQDDMPSSDEAVSGEHEETVKLPSELISSSEESHDELDRSSTSTDLDSPLPIFRAGPVVIPTYSHHLMSSIRADPSSPYRGLAKSSVETQTEIDPISFSEENEQTIRLGGIDSPGPSRQVSQTPLHNRQTPPHLQPLSTSLSVTPSLFRPLTQSSQPLGVAQRGAKVLKSNHASASTSTSTSAVPISPDKTKPSTLMQPIGQSNKAAARALAIRGQLDAVFTTKLSAFGPPSRTASSCSTSSSSSAASNGKSKSTFRPPGSGVARIGPSKSKGDVFLSSVGEGSPNSSISSTTSVRPSKPSLTGVKASRSFVKTTIQASQPYAKVYTNVPPSSALPRPRPASAQSTAPRQVLASRPLSTTLNRPTVSSSSVVTKPSRPPFGILSHTTQNVRKQQSVSVARSNPVQPEVSQPLKRPLHPVESVNARPMVTLGPVPAGSRPTMGLPMRVVREFNHTQSLPTFSLGGGGGGGGPALGIASMARPMYRSPERQGVLGKRSFADTASRGTPTSVRTFKLGTPSRATGTPIKSLQMRSIPMSAPRMVAPLPVLSSVSQSPPAHDVSLVEPSSSTGPPSTATRHASENVDQVNSTISTASSSTLPPQRGSSEDNENVSFQLAPAGSSDQASSPPEAPGKEKQSEPEVEEDEDTETEEPPNKTSAGSSKKTESLESGRPKRAIKPPTTATPNITTNPPVRGRSQTQNIASIAPNMSEKELRSKTLHNTMKNQVYFCAIERQIVRKNGARPPSPDSKMRSSFVRPPDEEVKVARGERAAKRRGEDFVIPPTDDLGKEEFSGHRRGRGDEEDYVTPVRHVDKRFKVSRNEDDGDSRGSRDGSELGKNVRWDKGLVMVCEDDLQPHPSSNSSGSGNDSSTMKSCIKEDAKIPLDPHGNVVEANRPVDQLKRTRIVVTAVYYDGEEPAPAPTQATRSKGKR